MTFLDGAILLAFAAWAVAVGFRARGEAGRGLEDYFLAGRGLSGWQAGVSMAATQFAADTPLLVTGLVATAGVFSLWRLWIYALAFLLLGFVLAPSWRRSGVLTDAALAELRYGGRAAGWLRTIKALYFGTVFNCVVLAMVLFAAKEIAEPFLRWHAWLPEPLFEPVVALVRAVGVPFARPGAETDLWIRSADNLISVVLLVATTLLYSASGGLRGVVQTDTAQFAVMMVGTLLYAAWVVDAVGGLGELAPRLAALFPEDGTAGLRASQILAFEPGHAADASFAVLAVLGLQWLVQMNADGTGYLAQRTLACRSDRDARTAAVVFTVAQVLLRSLLWLPIAVGLLVLYPPAGALGADAFRAEREATFVRGMADLLPPGVLGLLLTAMLAALASTVDTHLNWGASYWTHDLYARLVTARRGRRPEGRELVRVARLSSVAIVIVAMAVMTRLSSIQTAWQASLLLGAGMGVPLVLRWVWWRFTAAGEIAAIAVSTALAPVLLATGSAEATRLLLLAAVATGAGVAASLWRGPESEATLVEFYRRARPPGFWGPIARAAGADAGADRRRLARGLGATVLCAGAVFCALVGLGTALVGAPAPGAIGRGPWVVGLLLAALALVLPAWRLGAAAEVEAREIPGSARDERPLS